jgi:hypothetical protein
MKLFIWHKSITNFQSIVLPLNYIDNIWFYKTQSSSGRLQILDCYFNIIHLFFIDRFMGFFLDLFTLFNILDIKIKMAQKIKKLE